ncbi:hypothetical protein [Candidatus Acidianus copahuensis]|uniref:hypothetical protein n=1 Tax=Candidatus Acidianus copahuensis TaxID=1160895 RepID=UPI00190F266F|nr:hypothetical protein [Candidatus Acidianus copahuensis]
MLLKINATDNDIIGSIFLIDTVLIGLNTADLRSASVFLIMTFLGLMGLEYS